MDEKFVMYDEAGKEKEMNIIGTVVINNQEYVLYSIYENELQDGIYVSKIIKDNLGNETVVSIEDDSERNLVFDSIKNLINNV